MQTFLYTTYVGDFFDVLHMKSPLPEHIADACVAQFGSTARQEAVLSRYFGDLALAHAAAFAASLSSLISTPVKMVVLDLSELTSFCPNAAGHLVNFAANTRGRVSLVLFRPSGAVTRLLQQLGLEYIFRVIDTEDDLILALPDVAME
jgi:anti-anti-sigma factor